MGPIEDWFLTAHERGNHHSQVPAWRAGNRVTPLVHGASYFDQLVTEVDALERGDHLFFTDWRGDPDQRLRPNGPTIADLFSDAAERGVIVKGLIWRSHIDQLQYSEEENRHLGEKIEVAGGETLLDQRVRFGGSHHQKLVVIRHPGDIKRDVAFVGGIDLCHSRRDDEAHHGDPQAVRMNAHYGDHPPWHDVQARVQGPVVGAFDTTFRERWTDPAPLDLHSPIALLRDRLSGADLSAGELPPQPPDPPPCGPHSVQLLRTYPNVRRGYAFAPEGERTIARGYAKAIRRARRLIYLEDQYLWSTEVAELFADALQANPDLHLVAVVPRHPDVDGRLALPPNKIGREKALSLCRDVGGDRVHVFDVENHDGVPVYVHAKVCIIDDIWASIGSDNFNRRSWTHDSELSCAVLDSTRQFARDLRLTLLREHLDRQPGDDRDLVGPESAVEAVTRSAERLAAWKANGRIGARPPGRLTPHEPEPIGIFTKLWAAPVYRLVYDPDGRPRSARDRW